MPSPPSAHVIAPDAVVEQPRPPTDVCDIQLCSDDCRQAHGPHPAWIDSPPTRRRPARPRRRSGSPAHRARRLRRAALDRPRASSAGGQDPERSRIKLGLFGEIGLAHDGPISAGSASEIAHHLAEIERKLDALAWAALSRGGLVFGVVKGVALAEAGSMEGEDHHRILAAAPPHIRAGPRDSPASAEVPAARIAPLPGLGPFSVQEIVPLPGLLAFRAKKSRHSREERRPQSQRSPLSRGTSRYRADFGAPPREPLDLPAFEGRLSRRPWSPPPAPPGRPRSLPAPAGARTGAPWPRYRSSPPPGSSPRGSSRRS